MRNVLKKILEILDGTPADYGEKRQGQSVVELALVTPLIAILIVGIVEIGWFANNYLILLEVSRVGARRAAVLTGDNSPLIFDDRASLHYRFESLDPRHPTTGLDEDPYVNYTPDEYALIAQRRRDVRDCSLIGLEGNYVGFYNLVLCQMLGSLDPIIIDPEAHGTVPESELSDDIIISVFSVQMIENDASNTTGVALDTSNDWPDSVDIEEYIPGWNPVVVGRYPAHTNECNTYEYTNAGGGQSSFWVNPNTLERDPFDYYNDGLLTMRNLDWVGAGIPGPYVAPDKPPSYPIEVAFESSPNVWTWSTQSYDDDRIPEFQRGFVYTGYHRVEGEPLTGNVPGIGNVTAQPLCYGSEWTVYEVEELMRGMDFQMSAEEIQQMRDADPNFGKDEFGNDIDTRQFLADIGLVLVEIHWKHTLLLDIPGFSPIFNALGTNTTVINVWSAFPVPAATPKLRFDLTPANFFDEE